MKKLLIIQLLLLNHFILFGQYRFPINAIEAISSAYDTTSIVFFGESHDKLELLNFYVALINDSKFQEKVDDIVLELGNSRYQDVLDEYIAGKKVDYCDVRKVWFNATNSLIQLGDSSLIELLINEIRITNLKLSDNEKFRVVISDPPIDWSSVESPTDFYPWLGRRDLSFITSIWYEVIDKKRNAFVIMGRRHLIRNDPKPLNYISVVDILEKRIGDPIPVLRVEEDLQVREGLYPIEQTDVSNKPIISGFNVLYSEGVDAIINFNKLTPLIIHPYTNSADLSVLNERSMVVNNAPFKFNSYDYLNYLMMKKGIEGIHQFFFIVKENDSKIEFNEQLIRILLSESMNDEWKKLIESYLSQINK